jgi:hypothetical protein
LTKILQKSIILYMAKRGPKVKYTPAVLEKIRQKIEAYTDETEVPILKEFAYKNHILTTTLYEHPELSFSIKRLIEKKEAELERGMLTGRYNATGCVFSLKQLGWRDRQEIETTIKFKKPEDVKNRIKQLEAELGIKNKKATKK